MKNDEKYITTGMAMTPVDIQSGAYLRPLSNVESLGLFLDSRAGVLYANKAKNEDVFRTLYDAHTYFRNYPGPQLMMSWRGLAPPLLAKSPDAALRKKLSKTETELSSLKNNMRRYFEDQEAVRQGRFPMHGTMQKIHNPFQPVNPSDPTKKNGLEGVIETCAIFNF